MKYPGQESSTLEFKREVPTKQELCKTVIGFCNLYGGRLVIGVDDNGEVVGIPESEVDELLESLQQSIYNNCTPIIIPEIHAQRMGEKLILVVEISEGMSKPYFHASKGMDEGTYLRMGRQTLRASPEMIRELQWQSKGRSPDVRPIYHATTNDLNIKAVEKFLNNRIQKEHGSKANSSEELMMHYKILVKEQQRIFPSIAGMLLFGKSPQDFLYESYIIGTHFKGSEGRDVLATRDFSGTLFDQYEECIAFIISRLNRQFTITKAARRNEKLEIPEIALREILLNAIVHRDYFLPGPIKVAIFDNRIEIFSPGTFPGPLNSSNLEMGLTYIRNFTISRIMREAGYIEKLGTGFLTLFKTYREEKLPEPVVTEGQGFVKCILPRRSLQDTVVSKDQAEQQLLKLFLITDEIKAKDVIDALSISRSTASRLLNKLVSQGLLIQLGQGSATRYKRSIEMSS